jgi:hypothetical protein
MAADPRELARVQALCWLLDDLLDAEDDLLALVTRPGALVGWRRQRLVKFCQRVGEGLLVGLRRDQEPRWRAGAGPHPHEEGPPVWRALAPVAGWWWCPGRASNHVIAAGSRPVSTGNSPAFLPSPLGADAQANPRPEARALGTTADGHFIRFPPCGAASSHRSHQQRPQRPERLQPPGRSGSAGSAA